MRYKYLIPQFGTKRDPIRLMGECNFGHSTQNQIQLSDPEINALHARIEIRSGEYHLIDLKSRSGTFLNQVRVSESRLITGDIIQLGTYSFIFQNDDFLEIKNRLDTKNPVWKVHLNQVPNLARSDLPILLLGESGTGKEVLSSYIHNCSYRRNMKFMSVNCSALSEALIESELFGHVKGGFTGATHDRKGAFEEARGGTLFLDEIGDLPLNLQPKLLRALENNEIKPVGSDKIIKTNVRIIAATHLDIKKKIIENQFRADLFYRLNVVQIRIPRLIDRMEDFEKILYDFAKDYRVSFSEAAITQLKKHKWPGNIRELKNVVSRASALFPQESIQLHHLDLLIETLEVEDPFKKFKDRSELPLLKEIEKEMIKQHLVINHGNQRKTARDLGIPKSTLNDRIKQYGIKINDIIGMKSIRV